MVFYDICEWRYVFLMMVSLFHLGLPGFLCGVGVFGCIDCSSHNLIVGRMRSLCYLCECEVDAIILCNKADAVCTLEMEV